MVKKLNKEFQKFKKGKLKKFTFKTNLLKFGCIGLKAVESGILNKNQIDSFIQNLFQKVKLFLPIKTKVII